LLAEEIDLKRLAVIICAIGLTISVFSLFQSNSDPKSDAPSAPLDFSKPVFTTSRTAICPTSLLLDLRADRAPDKVADMFNSIWSRSEKAKQLGCEELQPGISVSAAPLQGDIATVHIPGSSDRSWFTITSELTNDVPGQSEEQRKQLAEAHINATRSSRVTSADTSTPSIGTQLVTTPSRDPIPKGVGVAAADSQGFGAIICPDVHSLAASVDSAVDSPKGDNAVDQWALLKTFGCSYVPPGTPMISEGPNQEGSLAVVSVKLADGTEIRGLTFPSMFVQSQERQDDSGRQTISEPPAQPSAVTEQPVQLRGPGNGADTANEIANTGPFRPGEDGVGFPSCVYCPDPVPSEEARIARINGTVSLQLVVEPDGHAAEVQVAKGLGYGLDELAVQTVKRWQFKAASGPNGKPVPTIVSVEINFHLN
jgi:TonB family protein